MQNNKNVYKATSTLENNTDKNKNEMGQKSE